MLDGDRRIGKQRAEESGKVKADSPRSMPLAGWASGTCRRRERDHKEKRTRRIEAFVPTLPDLEFYNNRTVSFYGPAHQPRSEAKSLLYWASWKSGAQICCVHFMGRWSWACLFCIAENLVRRESKPKCVVYTVHGPFMWMYFTVLAILQEHYYLFNKFGDKTFNNMSMYKHIYALKTNMFVIYCKLPLYLIL